MQTAASQNRGWVIKQFPGSDQPCALIHRFQSPVLRELVLFLLVGGTSAGFYTAIGATLTAAGVRPSLAILLTLGLLIPPTYCVQHRVTFRSGSQHRTAFPRYVGTQLVGNAVGIIGAEIVPQIITSEPLLAFAAIALSVAVINYLCLKFWAFGG